MTQLLHGGMLSMTKGTYAMLNVLIIALIIWTGPRGVFMKENGYHWMSAVAMYGLLDLRCSWTGISWLAHMDYLGGDFRL
jgi:hypothetical protein